MSQIIIYSLESNDLGLQLSCLQFYARVFSGPKIALSKNCTMTQCDPSEEKPDCTSEGTGLLPVRNNARDKVYTNLPDYTADPARNKHQSFVLP